MISDNQSLTFDINGQDAVFEQMFRALGQIAQGNLVDTRNPADGTDSLINSDQAMDRVMGSLDLIQNALFNSSADTSTSNPDLYSILAKTNSNTVLLNNVTENQTLVKNNLEHFVTEKRRQDGGCNQTAAGGRKPAGFLFGHADDHELVDFGLPQVERGGNRGREKAFPEREGLFL